MKQCYYPGCSNNAIGGYCKLHLKRRNTKKYIKKYDNLYNTERWRRESKEYLDTHKYCVVCTTKSEIVDHKRSHRGNELLFWNKDNWQALCKRCHGRKNIKDARVNGSSKRMG